MRHVESVTLLSEMASQLVSWASGKPPAHQFPDLDGAAPTPACLSLAKAVLGLVEVMVCLLAGRRDIYISSKANKTIDMIN